MKKIQVVATLPRNAFGTLAEAGLGSEDAVVFSKHRNTSRGRLNAFRSAMSIDSDYTASHGNAAARYVGIRLPSGRELYVILGGLADLKTGFDVDEVSWIERGEDATPRGKLLARARVAQKRLDRAWTLAMRTETPEAWAAVDAAQMEHAHIEHEIARIVGNA